MFARRKPVLVLSGLSLSLLIASYHYRRREPRRFTSTTLVESVDVSPNTKLLTLALPLDCANTFAPISSIFIKDSDIQVERPYTPLEGIDRNGHVKLWVKKYPRGEVSRWLHSRKVGDAIEIRGPVKTWSPSWQNGPWDEVVLISGGTGITPFYQLLHSVFNAHDPSLDTRFTLLHSSRSLADLPPSSMLQSLATLSQDYPGKFRSRFFTTESTEVPSDEHRFLNIQHGRIDKSVVQDALRLTHSASWWKRPFGLSTPSQSMSDKKILVLVCGPEGMVNAIAGPYGRSYSQGQVGGILGELGLRSHQVWKL